MGAVFIPQTLFDGWVIDTRISVEAEVLRIPDGDACFLVEPAVRFTQSVGRPGDPLALLGRVYTHKDVADRGWEHYLGSVLVGDDGYEVEEGYLATPIDASMPGSDQADEDGRLRKILAELSA